jgi:cobalamin biosynthesis protein CobT
MKPSLLNEKVRHFPILASMLGKRYGVEVIFHGEQPKTDGKRVVLPALTDDLTEEEMMLLTGFLDHEAGAHGQHMDFEAWFSDHNGGIAKEIKNILCDARDERLLGRDYPGCRENLRKLVEILDKRGIIYFGTDNAPGAFLGWLFHVVHAACGRFPKAVKEHPDAVRKFLTDTCIARIEYEALKAIAEPETAGVVARTCNILKILQEEKDTPPPPRQQGKNNPDDGREEDDKEENSVAGGGSAGDKATQDDSVSNGDSEQKQRCDSAENDDGRKPGGNQDCAAVDGDETASDSCTNKRGDDPGGHGEKSGTPDIDGSESVNDNDDGGQTVQSLPYDNIENMTGDNDASDDQAEGNQGQPGQSLQWTCEQIEEILAAAYNGAGDLGKILQDELAETIGIRGAGPQGLEIPGVAEFEKMLTKLSNVEPLRQTTAQLRGRFLALIQASRYKPASTALTGRRLGKRVLARVAIGNMRIFERREPREAVNTAMVILGDSSGSMSGKKAEMAFLGAFISSEAMKSIPGTATLVAAYPANAGDSADLGILKGWTENTKPVQPATDGHWTPIAEALQWARIQLAFRREARKIVLILTDGESSDDDRARKAVLDLEADGIELIAIGILCDSPQRWTSRYRQIDDIKELPAAMVEMLREQLVENRRFKKIGQEEKNVAWPMIDHIKPLIRPG